jgi:hypothetical protein
MRASPDTFSRMRLNAGSANGLRADGEAREAADLDVLAGLGAISSCSCLIVLPSYLSPLTCSWLSSTTSESHFLIWPSTIFGRMFSGLSEACSSKSLASRSRAAGSTSSSVTNSGLAAATCSAMSRAKATKSSLRATKSVSQLTSTRTPTFAFEWHVRLHGALGRDALAAVLDALALLLAQDLDGLLDVARRLGQAPSCSPSCPRRCARAAPSRRRR